MSDEEKSAEEKQAEYANNRLIKVMKLGVDQSLNGTQNVCQFSSHEIYKGDERWKAVTDQAHRAFAELLLLQIQFELIVGHTKTRDED